MSNKKILLTALSIILLPHGFSFANPAPDINDAAYSTIADVSITVTETDNNSPAKLEFLPGKSEKAAPIAVGAIVNAGLTAWGVINSAQPNGNYSSNYANAMPNWVDWNTIAGWKGPKEITYGVKVKNLLGITVVDVKYMLSYFYGGTSGSGGSAADCIIAAGCGGGAATCPAIAAKCEESTKSKGSYISNLRVKPISVEIKWGFKFDLDVAISNPMNIGTVADPVAYLQTDLMWALSTPFKKNRGVWTYAVDGKGNFKDLTRETKAINNDLFAPQQVADVPAVSWN
ncbi:MAG: hypothetical protein A2218_00220 [Elusimicrobia bacterium RIFOXYA2_FULL_53_38]|nr:MAG: hypothetical protein A2218_00220 [Elusimicrobia bacterium RIFOXYA2_FULL_53_38]